MSILKKKELEVTIHCEGPFAPFVYRRLLRLNDCHKKHTALTATIISSNDTEAQGEKIGVQHVTYYDTLHIINTLEIKFISIPPPIREHQIYVS